MTKKGKRPSSAVVSSAADTSRRRSSASSAGTSTKTKCDTIHACRAVGPPVLPPPRSDGNRKRLELDLVSKRVYQETIFSIESLLSASECAAWINYGEGQGFERSFHKQTSEMAHRDNGRITLHSPQVAAALFARVGSFVPAEMGRRKAVACNANIRVYRYAAGQRFGKHVDESVEDEHGNISQWTVLIYLNGGAARLSGGDRSSGGSEAEAGVGEETLRGGETVFYKGNYGGKVAASFSPVQGACLIHGHGRQCLLHEGAAVTSGVKYLLRTDIMNGLLEQDYVAWVNVYSARLQASLAEMERYLDYLMPTDTWG